MREGFLPLPYKEPSATLFQLMTFMVEEGRRLGHNYIGTEHLLLGLIREGEGPLEGLFHDR